MAGPWTPPIRYAVIAWFGFGLLWNVAAPFWLIGPVSDIVAIAVNFGVAPPNADEVRAAEPVATQVIVGWAVVTGLVDVFAVAVAVRRSAWAYIIVEVFLVVWMLVLIREVLTVAAWSSNPVSDPLWMNLALTGFAAISSALGVWMVVAVMRRRRSG